MTRPMQRLTLAAAAAGLLALALAAPAVAMDDATFLQTAIGANLAEIQVGQLAQANSQNADVKAYGQMLVTDHSAANQKATALAQAVNTQVPGAPSPVDQATYNQLKGLTGADFDEAFLTAMVKGHTDVIAMFKDKSDDSTNDVSAFAKDALPTLQQHLDKANALLQSVNAAPAAAAAPADTPAPAATSGAAGTGTTNGSGQ